MEYSYYYVYVLYSLKDKKFYTGYTQNLRNRLKEHKNGKVKSTMNRRPVELVYFEGCLSQQDATKREKYLKTTCGKRYIRNRINKYLTG